MTVPGYPVFGTHTKWYGGEVFNLKLTAENSFLPDLASIPADILRRAKVLVLNYPNNPTGASATRQFFTKAVAFAKQHNLVIISDAAYAALVFEGQPLSILSIPGAKDVAVELHSMSKGFNMTGWRLGFVAGNELLFRAYGDVKDNSDSGQFLAIQKACAASLDHPEITQQIAAKYSRRMDLLVTALRKFGFDARKPQGSFFLYVRAPKAVGGQQFNSAEDVSQWLITEKLISTVPWDDAGAYLRFSATFSAKGETEERRVVGEIERRFAGLRFEF
jgi:LL-diaminopimelate aminotransferase